MDHLSFSSSDVDEDAVEELLSQILDEEVLRITTIPAGKQGPLDPELEARYEKLKASVVLNPRPRNLETVTKHSESCSKRRNLESPPGSNPSSSSEQNTSFSSTTLQEGDSNSSPREREQGGRSRSSARTFMASPSRRSISPPPPRSCFCGSPKKLLRSLSSRKSQRKSAMSETGSDSSRFATKKSIAMKDDGIEVISKVKGGNLQDELDALSDEEFLTDLSTFSLKSQQKKLKKALSEEEKVNREAEELVKWVKQASARMDVSISDESLSDEDELKR